MKMTITFASIAALLLLTGCWPSLHPIYTPDDLISEPDLVGKWGTDDSQGFYEFTQDGEKGYHLLYQDDEGVQSEFEVHLIKLGNYTLMDFFPEELNFEITELYKAHLMPVHSFTRIVELSDSLAWQYFDYNFIEAALKANPEALKHERVEDITFLTASTEDLQAFILKHLEVDEAWGGSEAAKRLQ